MLAIMTILLQSIVYSWSTIRADVVVCETSCRYTAYAKDAECTNRGLDAIPAGCRQAQTFDISSNMLESLVASSLDGFWQLIYLHLEDNQISSIEPGVFTPVKRRLQLINISSNHLTSIQGDTFVNMTGLKYLLLSHNRISEISSGAFKGMTKLAKIYLGDNEITVLDYSMFDAMPKLQELNLRNNRIVSFQVSFIQRLVHLQKIFVHNNSIVEVTGHVDAEQTSLILINLSFNLISSFSCSVVDNLFNLNNLYLSNNSLQSINDCSKDQISSLKLNNNPFNCDCQLQELGHWLRQHPDVPSPTCSTPINFNGTLVRDFVFQCGGDTMTTTRYSTEGSNWNRRITPRSYLTSVVTNYPQRVDPSVGLSRSNGLSMNKPVIAMNKPVTAENDFADSGLENSLKEKYDAAVRINTEKSGIILLIILIAIVVLILAILLLSFVLVIKYYGRQRPDKNYKSSYLKPTMYPGTPAVFPGIPAVYPGVPLDHGEDPTIELTLNHNYERIPQPLIIPRHSTGSESCDATMVCVTPNGVIYPNNSGMYNPGMEDCTCECHEDMSESCRSSWADGEDMYNEMSYQMDNNFNETCDCPPYQANCCGMSDMMPFNQVGVGQQFAITSFGKESQTVGHPPPVSFFHPHPPPLPPLPKIAKNEIYILHNQV